VCVCVWRFRHSNDNDGFLLLRQIRAVYAKSLPLGFMSALPVVTGAAYWSSETHNSHDWTRRRTCPSCALSPCWIRLKVMKKNDSETSYYATATQN